MRTCAVRRMNMDERWDSELVKKMKGTPQQPDPAKSGSAVSIRVSFRPLPGPKEPVPQEPLRKELKMRKVYINQKILETYRCREECAGCRIKGARFSEARKYSEVCLARITKAMEGDEEGRDKTRRERITRQSSSPSRREREARQRQVKPTRSRHGGSMSAEGAAGERGHKRQGDEMR